MRQAIVTKYLGPTDCRGAQFGWVGDMVGGGTLDGYCFVFPD